VASAAVPNVERKIGSWKWGVAALGGLILLLVVVRGPLLYSPFWERARQNAGPDGPLALGTEWGMRLPFTLASIAALCVLCLAVSRIASRRAAYATAVCLSTMPLYFLLSRQSRVSDAHFVALLMGAFACALIGQFDETTKRRSALWY